MKKRRSQLAENWDLHNIAQALGAVCFSLWRAVFLSDLTRDESAHLSDAEAFLGNLILHNTVAYLQDRNAREWTFSYYVNNGHYRLKQLSERYENFLPAFEDWIDLGDAKGAWMASHDSLVTAINKLDEHLERGTNP